MSIFSSYKKIFLLGFIIVILIAIPFSVYIAQERQRTISMADKSTTLTLVSSDPTIKTEDINVEVGKNLSLDIVLDPASGNNPNQVSFVKLSFSFDPSKFTTIPNSLQSNPDPANKLTTVLEGPLYTSGKATISLSIGANPADVQTVKSKIATLQLKAIAPTTDTKSIISFDPNPATQVLSLASTDETSENVLILSSASPVSVTVNSASTDNPSAPAPNATPTTAPAVIPNSPSGEESSAGRNSSLPSQENITTSLTGEDETEAIGAIPTIIAPTAQVLEPLSQAVEVLPPTGPGEKILGVGLIGVALAIIGGALLFVF